MSSARFASIPRSNPKTRLSFTSIALAAALAVWCSAAGRAVAAGTDAQDAGAFAVRVRGSEHELARVHHDTAADGTLWSRGASYKASFDAFGASFIPFLGAAAPRNFPVRFALESVTSAGRPLDLAGAVPVRAGDAITYDRGSVIERYELTPDFVEQIFVFESPPRDGDLTIRIRVESELAPVAVDPVSIDSTEPRVAVEFRNPLGCVRYGTATAIDAAGARLDVSTVWTDARIEIRVPADFLARAVFPLTVDPIVATFSIDVSTQDDIYPDVAYDVTNDVYLVTWERAFSATDSDVWAELRGSTGALVPGSGEYIDFTGDSWIRPRVANNNIANQFLVVAERRAAGITVGRIYGRTRDAAGAAMSLQFDISTLAAGSLLNADVGGDPYFVGPTYYCVVWETDLGFTDHDVYCRLVRTDGTLHGTSHMILDGSPDTLDRYPRISKSNGNGPDTTQRWNVVWQRSTGPFSPGDIRMAQLWWDGTVVISSTLIDGSATDNVLPCASSVLDGAVGPRRWLLMYGDYTANPRRLVGRLMEGATTIDSFDLTSLDPPGAISQFLPSVDSDGQRFVAAYHEAQINGPQKWIYNTTLTPVGNEIKLSESQVFLATGPNAPPVTKTSIVAERSGGGGPRRAMTVWHNDSIVAGDYDIYGALYDAALFTSYCIPGVDAYPCPCGNPPATLDRGCNNSADTGGAILTASGVPALTADSLVFLSGYEKPTALSIVLQGDVATLAYFGQGVRCTGGNLKRLYVKNAVAGFVQAPVGGDPSVSARSAALGDPLSVGSAREYSVYYRDPTVLGGCSSFATFNTTQTLHVVWMQ